MSSPPKICFNPDCKAAKSERWRRGWWLRTGDFAELCERCGSAFEEGRFCDTFHSDADGWRSCESCGKRLHCGCIISIHSLVLLDAGGVDCISCARKNISMASNQMRPSSLFLPVPERLKDLSVKNWNLNAGPSAVAGQWRHPLNLRNITSHLEFHPRIPYEVDSESKNLEDLSERVMSSSLNPANLDRLANGNAGVDTVTAFQTFHKEEGNLDTLQSTSHLIRDKDPLDTKKVGIAEPCLNTSVSGLTYEVHPNASTSKDDSSTSHFVSGTQSHLQTPPPPLAKQFYASLHNGVDAPGETQIRNGRPRGDARGRNQLLSRYWPKITDQELQQISGNSNSVITPLFEKMLSASDAGRIGRLVLPKKCAEAYFPTISQPEGLPLKVQDAKGNEWVFQFRFWPNNNSRMYVLEGVTPCIQSMQLQAGDIVTFSRIDPEGKLVMGFRKASSVPPSDQDKRTLKAGKNVSKNAEANNKKSKPSENISTPNRPLRGSAESTSYSSINQVNLANPAATWSKVDKSGYIAKEVTGADSFLLPRKRKSNIIRSKSKRLQIEKEDLTELKLTWEEAQGLFRPPLNNVPSVVVIEGHEFEEYEEAPILGKPTISTINDVGENIQWAQCEDCSKWRKLPGDALLTSRWTCSNNSWDPKRSSCSSAQEVTTEQLKDLLLSSNPGASKKTKAVKKESDADEASAGLDTLANLAILGEGEVLPPSAQPTTRHPRHRAGCTCIVCIQPPSGKGPKHKDSCTCNVCLTVKRRFRTLMLRREKRQSEKEAESARKKLQLLQLPDDPEQQDYAPLIGNTSDPDSNQKIVTNECSDGDPNKKKPSLLPFKGQIDLNIQPEREDEPSPVSDSGSMMRLLPDPTDMYLKQQGLVSSAGNRDQLTNQIVLGGGGSAAGGEKLESGAQHGNGQTDGDMDHPIISSISVRGSTAATG